MPHRRAGPFVACIFVVAHAAAVSAEQVREVEVIDGDRTIRALCTEGPREAILLHDASESAERWLPVLDRLAGEVGACAYDRRRGDGGSGPERGWFELLDDLRGIHAALGVRPGYVLVGVGSSGLYARLFAVDRPGDVGGLVLIEPAHEDWPREARAGMPRRAWSEWVEGRRRPNADGVRVAELARRARGTRLPDIPVTVITAMERESGEGWNTRFLVEAARRVHASILRGVRVARHVPAARSGHNVPLEAPELVAEEISRMVRMTNEATR